MEIPMKKLLFGMGAAIVALGAGPASAHVTVQPTEAISESFSRFVVRVPTEREDAATTKVVVNFPPLAFVSFQDVPGWSRQVKMTKLDEPLEAFGSEITEAVGTVTWTGGEIGPGEFSDFPFSAAMPAGENDLEFSAVQTYDSGEVVRWTGGEESESPAAHVDTVELGEFGQDVGETGAVHNIAQEVEEISGRVEELTAEVDQAAQAPETSTEGNDADDSSSDLGVWLGAGGLALGALALIVALTRRRA
jgi:uncharacterized protein YcnI